MSFSRLAGRLLPLMLLGLAACRSEAENDSGSITPPPSTTPVSGYLSVKLTTPRTDDGAVQVAVSGPQIDSVKLVSYNGFATTDGIVANLVVTGAVTSGEIARVYVSDVGRASAYSATVSAAAARQTYALQSLDGYQVSVAKQ
jgi:hypothetical protein